MSEISHPRTGNVNLAKMKKTKTNADAHLKNNDKQNRKWVIIITRSPADLHLPLWPPHTEINASLIFVITQVNDILATRILKSRETEWFGHSS